MEAAKGTIQVCPGPTANAGIMMISQDTEEKRKIHKMLTETPHSLLIVSYTRGFGSGQKQ